MKLLSCAVIKKGTFLKEKKIRKRNFITENSQRRMGRKMRKYEQLF